MGMILSSFGRGSGGGAPALCGETATKQVRVFHCSRCHQLYNRGKGLLSLIMCPFCRSSEVTA
jgi:hypothetical protein